DVDITDRFSFRILDVDLSEPVLAQDLPRLRHVVVLQEDRALDHHVARDLHTSRSSSRQTVQTIWLSTRRRSSAIFPQRSQTPISSGSSRLITRSSFMISLISLAAERISRTVTIPTTVCPSTTGSRRTRWC